MTDKLWLQRLYFITDLCEKLNQLNLKLQGTRDIALFMMEEIVLFEKKLCLFVDDADNGILSHFPKLRYFLGSKGICDGD